MYQFSAVYQIVVVITDFRTVTLAVISNTSSLKQLYPLLTDPIYMI